MMPLVLSLLLLPLSILGARSVYAQDDALAFDVRDPIEFIDSVTSEMMRPTSTFLTVYKSGYSSIVARKMSLKTDLDQVASATVEESNTSPTSVPYPEEDFPVSTTEIPNPSQYSKNDGKETAVDRRTTLNSLHGLTTPGPVLPLLPWPPMLNW